MTRRENTLSLLRRRGYEKVPVDFNLCPHLEEIYKARTGGTQPYKEYFGMPLWYLPLLRLEDEDVSRFYPYHPNRDDRTVIDHCGVGHRSTPTSMHMSQMLHPLKDADSVEQILTYPYPVAKKEENIEWIRRDAEEIRRRDYLVCANMNVTLWESAWYIRGMEPLMMDMLCALEMAEALLDRITGLACDNARIYAQGGAELLLIGDDVGMQHSTMMSLEMFTQWIKPRLTQFIQSAKAVNPDILIMFHSCGTIQPFIPHLIEAGIDVLNPIQPECMDFQSIHEQFGEQVSFHGTIGTQSTMPWGTPAEVRREVERNLKIAGDHGGLFPAPTHLLEPEVPWENILAYVDACIHYGG